MGGGPDKPSGIYKWTGFTEATLLASSSSATVDAAYISTPEPVAFPTTLGEAHFCRVDDFSDASRRRRGRDADNSVETGRGDAAARGRKRHWDVWARLSTPPRPRRGYAAKMGRGDAAAATRIIPWRRVAAAPRPRRGYSVKRVASLRYGFYYKPRHPTCSSSEAAPPLLVKAHGGPTACTGATFNPTIQYWTSRGFAVLDVDYGGSTGYGRDYRRRLRGSWGVVDIDDVCAGATFLANDGLADPKRLAIDGGSAGGYTTLGALAFRDVFSAGCSLYGVADLEMLAGDTHKFESRSLSPERIWYLRVSALP